MDMPCHCEAEPKQSVLKTSKALLQQTAPGLDRRRAFCFKKRSAERRTDCFALLAMTGYYPTFAASSTAAVMLG